MGNEIIILTPVLDVFSPIYKRKALLRTIYRRRSLNGRMGPSSSMATSLPFPSLSSQIQENFVELSTLSLLLTRNLGSDAGESFISCMSLIKADFRYRRPGFLHAMLALEYEINK